MTTHHKNRGFGLIEVVLAAAIISLTLFGLLGVSQNFLKLSRQTTRHIQANFLLEEGVEALRSIRDDGYTSNIATLNTSTTYWLYWNDTNNIWQATTTQQIIDDLFHRTFTVEDVYRDSNDDIADTGTLDSETRQFNLTVSWQTTDNSTTSKSVSTYLTNFFND